MMKTISYSAPAKIILSGEHAVVYGKPALVSAIDLRLTLQVTFSKKQHSNPLMLQIAEIVRGYLQKKQVLFSDNPFHFLITSHIPIGRGLGSSAALSVAAAAALLEWFSGRQWEENEIGDCAYEIEKLFHKNPSGVDTSASCFGGLLFYRKEFSFLKEISRLPFSIPQEIAANLVLIDSGKPKETTAEMVGFVQKNYSDPLCARIESVTKEMVESLVQKNVSSFKHCLTQNELLLEKMGVVSLKTKYLLKMLKRFGVGKIGGAGGKKNGSGFVLFYKEKENELFSFLNKRKIQYLSFIPTEKGVQKVV